MSSEGKARKFEGAAIEHGWTTRIEELGADHWSCNCVRGDEIIDIFWVNNTLTETPKYTFAGATTSLHNSATATRQLALQPDLQRAYNRTRKNNRARGATTGDELVHPSGSSVPTELAEQLLSQARGALPFDIWKSTDKEILRAIRGSSIVFMNSMTNTPEVVHVMKSLNMNLLHFNVSQAGEMSTRPTGKKLDPEKGRPMVNFIAMEGHYKSFRSVALESILKVG